MGDFCVTRTEPRYWGSWKGRVIRAVVVDNAKTWNEIHGLTGLSSKSLNRALYEMFELGVLEKKADGTYRVSHDIYAEYKDFFGELAESGKSVRTLAQTKFSEDMQESLVKWIHQWKELKELSFSLKPQHFFLEGRHLDDFSKELICKAKSEVLVVNPFVNNCDLSNTLREASRNGVEVRLITRPAETEKTRFRRDKEEYHGLLKEEGVKVMYNKAVHAKIVVVDRAVAVLSSMNFYSRSSAGASWEAGLISLDKTVVESVVDSILGLLEKPESKELL